MDWPSRLGYVQLLVYRAPLVVVVAASPCGCGRCWRHGGAQTFMLVAPYIAHRTPVWPHATSFKPDRFLSCPSGDADSSSPAPAFYPFSYGPRNCIGQVAAMVRVQLFLGGAGVVVWYRVSGTLISGCGWGAGGNACVCCQARSVSAPRETQCQRN